MNAHVSIEPIGIESGAVIDIPLNKLKKSHKNARKVPHTDAATEALAASIAVKGMLQKPVVEPEADEAGQPTGFWLVTIGEGRRLAQLLRVKRKEIKKTEPISCVVLITTDRRTYHLELRATPATYMASVSWRYAEDELIAVKAVAAARAVAAPVVAGVDLERLDFKYRLEGARARWRPQRVFDDGVHVVIEFPPGIAQAEMPPLFVLGADGKAELVNYRVSGRRMIVDRLFAAAELRLGGKGRQQRVRIVHVGPRVSP